MKKRLYRNPEMRVLGGVASGIADYFDTDPIIVRALFLVAIFGAGISFVIYFLMWIIIPKRPPVIYFNNNTNFANNNSENPSFAYQEQTNYQTHNSKSVKTAFGAFLIILGFLALADNFIPQFDFENFWPLSLVFVGVWILYKNLNQKSISGVSNEI